MVTIKFEIYNFIYKYKKQEICLRHHIQHTVSGRGMIINA